MRVVALENSGLLSKLRIKAELFVVSCISDLESPLLQPTAAGSQSRTGSLWLACVRRSPLPSSVPELLDPCPGCKPAQQNSQNPGASITSKAAGQGPPPMTKERIISHHHHADRDHMRRGRARVPCLNQISAADPLCNPCARGTNLLCQQRGAWF